ncbi:ATP-binding protein (plasmid) [Streptomyces sp. BHT-5-2]|uniref:ATP-binding protein n=1 Tax=unclassified Streptomyces TaxID=2593676 RepID=UPI001C8D3E14|nr:ATP-binding protein [Streptomyces sp. BHT-5-2]QZL07508.1 ATP-binding protein [Streptomyces sp. BHT-5-2]
MADHQESTRTLPSFPASVAAARGHVRDVLAQWGLPPGSAAADDLLLIVSELATNAVQHTRGRSPAFTVALRLDRDEQLCVGVTDAHPRPPLRLPAAVQQDNGRGLVIIRSLAASRGGRLWVEPVATGGKTVWVTVPWPAAAPCRADGG